MTEFVKKYLLPGMICLALTLAATAKADDTRMYRWQASDANHPAAVDVAIVLAVDVSSSVKQHERRFQREAYAAALSDPAVQRMALGGRSGRIALAYMEWSGANNQRVHLPMEILQTPEDIGYFADRILAIEDTPGDALYIGSTAIGDALIAAERAMRALDVPAREFVIDISGDGVVNSGSNVMRVRDHLVEIGLTVNGLPIRISNDSWDETEGGPDRVEEFYETCVIGGAGSFHLVADGFAAVRETLIMKLMLEMAEMEGAERRRIATNWNQRHGAPRERVVPAVILQVPEQGAQPLRATRCTHYDRASISPYNYP